MDDNAERRAKGVLVLEHVKIIRNTKDSRLLEGLSSEEHRIVTSHVLPSSWYPYSFYAKAIDLVHRHVCHSNPEMARDMGRYLGSNLFQGPYAQFLKKENPEGTSRGFVTVWKNLFSFGQVTFSEPKPFTADGSMTAMVGNIDGFTDIPRALCLMVQGFIEKAFEAAGTQGVSITEMSCASLAAGRCTYRVTWPSNPEGAAARPSPGR
jgi:predicted hydrocarbon binding protein